jgi:hypothetical protein
MAPTVRHNIRIFKELLVPEVEPRMADQVGTAMGCYSALIYDHKISKDEAQVHLSSINLNQSDYFEINETDESDDCFNSMMETIIDRQMMKTVKDFYDDNNQHVLKSIGLMRRDNYLYIANKNIEMKKIMNAAGYSNYIAVLRRHKSCVDRSTPMRIDNNLVRCVKIMVASRLNT